MQIVNQNKTMFLLESSYILKHVYKAYIENLKTDMMRFIYYLTAVEVDEANDFHKTVVRNYVTHRIRWKLMIFPKPE